MFKKLFSKSKFHLDSLLSPLKRCQRPLTSHFRAGGGVGGLRQRCRALAGSATPSSVSRVWRRWPRPHAPRRASRAVGTAEKRRCVLRPERLGSRVRGERSWLQPHPVRLTTPVSPERPTLRAEPSPGLDCAERTLLQQPRLPGLASPTRRRALVCERGRERGEGRETVRVSQRKGRLDAVWLQVALWTQSPAPLLTASISPPRGAHPGGPSGGDSRRSPTLVSPPPHLL